MFFITNPNQEDGVREEGEGQGEGSPDFSPQGPPDTVSPTQGKGLQCPNLYKFVFVSYHCVFFYKSQPPQYLTAYITT